MQPPRTPAEYRREIIQYEKRSYTKTIFHGFIYRFLKDLVKNDESELPERFADFDEHTLAYLSVFRAGHEPGHHSLQYSYSQLQDLLDRPLPVKGVGQVLFLGGHMPGSWIVGIGAKFGIVPEFFRRHIHLWRSVQGAILYAIPTLPSVNLRYGIPLRINTCGHSARSLGNLSLAARRNVLPTHFIQSPNALNPAPGSTYIRGHAFLDDYQFLIEQDISITIESDGDGWTAILWSDVGSRDLSQSQDFLWFLQHLEACTKTGRRWISLAPFAVLGIDSELRHPLPNLAQGPSDADSGSFVQASSHLPHEFHLMLDHDIAALDPLYALSPIFRFAAHGSNSFLEYITRGYQIISSTIWDPKHSIDYMNRLILQKHLLDDNAARHEQILRFLRLPHLAKWAEQLSPEQAAIAEATKRDVEVDFEYLARRCREYAEHHQTAIGILVNVTALAESKKQIRLATQVTKLTVLATVFLPLSFCTSIFGMNLVELDGLSVWVWALVTVLIGVVTLVMYMWDEREKVMELLGRVWVRVSGRSQDVLRERGMA